MTDDYSRLVVAPRLDFLPDDLLIPIFKNLSLNDILALRQTCTRLSEISHARTIWLSVLRSVCNHHSRPINAGLCLASMSTSDIERLSKGPSRLERAWLSTPVARSQMRLSLAQVPTGYSGQFLILPGGRYLLTTRQHTAKGRGYAQIFDLDSEDTTLPIGEYPYGSEEGRVCDEVVHMDESGVILLVNIEIKVQIHHRYVNCHSVDIYHLQLPNSEDAPKGKMSLVGTMTVPCRPRSPCMRKDIAAFILDQDVIVFWNWKERRWAQVPFDSENSNSQFWTLRLEDDRIIMANSFTYWVCAQAIPNRDEWNDNVPQSISDFPTISEPGDHRIEPLSAAKWPVGGGLAAGKPFLFFPASEPDDQQITNSTTIFLPHCTAERLCFMKPSIALDGERPLQRPPTFASLPLPPPGPTRPKVHLISNSIAILMASLNKAAMSVALVPSYHVIEGLLPSLTEESLGKRPPPRVQDFSFDPLSGRLCVLLHTALPSGARLQVIDFLPD